MGIEEDDLYNSNAASLVRDKLRVNVELEVVLELGAEVLEMTRRERRAAIEIATEKAVKDCLDNDGLENCIVRATLAGMFVVS